MAEGEAFWSQHNLTQQLRLELLDKIQDVVVGWDNATEKWINYRSLKPIIGLLGRDLEHQIHMWATWALLSLCKVNPEKYCDMCFHEGALEALRILEHDSDTSELVRKQCTETIDICFKHKTSMDSDEDINFLPMEV